MDLRSTIQQPRTLLFSETSDSDSEWPFGSVQLPFLPHQKCMCMDFESKPWLSKRECGIKKCKKAHLVCKFLQAFFSLSLSLLLSLAGPMRHQIMQVILSLMFLCCARMPPVSSSATSYCSFSHLAAIPSCICFMQAMTIFLDFLADCDGHSLLIEAQGLAMKFLGSFVCRMYCFFNLNWADSMDISKHFVAQKTNEWPLKSSMNSFHLWNHWTHVHRIQCCLTIRASDMIKGNLIRRSAAQRST